MKWPLFVTLTQGNLVELTQQNVRDIRRAFGKLRQRQFWKQKVRGGVAAFEVTNIGNGWHLHLHAVIDCDWLSILSTPPRKWHTAEEKKWKVLVAKSELQEAWRQCLGQGTDPIVHVKRVDSDIVAEVVKYTIKGDELLEISEEIGPMIDAMDGTRMMTTFGNCYRLAARLEAAEGVSEFKCPAGHSDWLPEGIVESIHSKAREDMRHDNKRLPGVEPLPRAEREAEFKKQLRKKTAGIKLAHGLPAESVMPRSQSPVVEPTRTAGKGREYKMHPAKPRSDNNSIS